RIDQLWPRHTGGPQSLVNIEVEQTDIRLRHAAKRIEVYPQQLQERFLRETDVVRVFRPLQHLDVFCKDVFTRSRHLCQPSSLLDRQHGGRCGLWKRMPGTDPVREENFDLVV